jgi:hypothetical protein
MAKLDKMALFASVNYKPHDIQRAVHASSASRRVLCAGVRFGKTALAVHEVLAALLAPGPESRGWVVTPSRATTSLIIDPLFSLLRKHFAHRVVELDERERRAVVRNLGGGLAEVIGKSADRPAALLGESLTWLIVDEAARLREDLWTSVLSQRLVDRRGWALVCSTPHGAAGWFHAEYLRGARGEEGYESWTAPTWSNPAISREVIDSARSQLDERTFHREFGGEFIGPLGRTCPTCGSPRELQCEYVILMADQVLGRCGDCGRPLGSRGEPVGVLQEDGSVSLYRIVLRLDVPAPRPDDPCMSPPPRSAAASRAS